MSLFETFYHTSIKDHILTYIYCTGKFCLGPSLDFDIGRGPTEQTSRSPLLGLDPYVHVKDQNTRKKVSYFD